MGTLKIIWYRNSKIRKGNWKSFCKLAAAKSLHLCPTLCDPIDGSPPGPLSWDSPGKNTEVGCRFLLQCMKVTSESEVAQSCPTLSNPYQDPYQAPPSMGFSRQEYWSWVPLPFLFYSNKYLQKNNAGLPRKGEKTLIKWQSQKHTVWKTSHTYEEEICNTYS